MKKRKNLFAMFLLVCGLLLIAPTKTTVWAYNGGGISGNGLGGIYINIYGPDYNRTWDWGNPYGSTGCTWFVGARVKELTGKGNYITYSGDNWWNWYGESLGFTRSQTPAAHSVIVWKNHVAILEKIVGDTAYISEGGVVEYAYNDYCRLSTCSVSSISWRNSDFRGYLHFGSSESVPPQQENVEWWKSKDLVNAGDFFYSPIIKCVGWMSMADVNGNVELTDKADGHEVWRFERQSDGSYLIRNCKSERYLAVSGDNVVTKTPPVSNDYYWYVYGRWSGEYFLRSKSSSKTMDVSNNSNAVGTNVQLYDYNGTDAQKMAFYKLGEVGETTLRITPGNSFHETVFQWDNAPNATSYDILIEGLVDGDRWYKTISDLKETSYRILLPVGWFDVKIRCKNAFSYASSPYESCEILVGTHDYVLTDQIQGTCTIQGKKIYTCTVCQDSYTEYTPIVPHIYYDKTVIRKATDKAEGLIQYRCACGATKTETIPKKKRLSSGTVKNVSGSRYKVTGSGSSVEFTKPAATAKTVTIPAAIKVDGLTYKVTSIAANAFKNHKTLTKVTIGSNVQKIGAGAFYNCKKLTAVTIPSKVKSIGKKAFYGDSKLKNITIKSYNTLKGSIGSQAFQGVYKKAVVKIPSKNFAWSKTLLRKKGMPSKASYKKI